MWSKFLLNPVENLKTEIFGLRLTDFAPEC